MTTTPPPPSALQMPPTPRHGAGYDQYEPYITRHSARIAGQRVSRTSTPPPSFPAFRTAAGSKSTKKEKSSSDEPEALSPPGSVHGSPRKKTSGRSRAYGPAHSLEDDTMGLTDPFTLSEPSSKQHPHSGFETTTTKTNGMLPTPAKTPKKKAVGDPGATARTLFPPSSMSGRPKKSKKHTGFSLDSFNDDTTQGRTQIAIYTDSRDRIPEVDENEGNLFYNPKEAQTTQTPGNPQPSRSSGRRKAVEAKQEKNLERDHEIEDAVKRDDGMVYVFRGKKMFRKFNDNVESDGEEDSGLGLLAARPDLLDSPLTANVRPLTRSAIKPRVLFPTTRSSARQQDHQNEVDEEAATDIEDHAQDTDDAADQAIDDGMEQRESTPPIDTTAAMPRSPGATTARSLRPRAKRDDEHETTPTISEPKRKRVSPFDGWLRKKQTPAATGTKTKKREAEAVGSPSGPSTKRPRGRAAVSSS